MPYCHELMDYQDPVYALPGNDVMLECNHHQDGRSLLDLNVDEIICCQGKSQSCNSININKLIII